MNTNETSGDAAHEQQAHSGAFPVATGSVASFPWNPKHPIGTCANCGAEMVYNVPRLGPGGGYVHKETGSLECVGPQNIQDQPRGAKTPKQ